MYELNKTNSIHDKWENDSEDDGFRIHKKPEKPKPKKKKKKK